jgi:hypothetical protein
MPTKLAGTKYTLGDDFRVDRSVVSTANPVSVRAFGAKGDGVTDDTEAIQAAIDYGATTRKPVLLSGAFGISSTLKLYANTVLIGVEGGRNFGSTLYWLSNAADNGVMLDINGDLLDFGVTPDSNPYAHQVLLKDIVISHAAGSPDLAVGIRVRKAYNIRITGVRLHSLRATDAIKIEDEVNDCLIEKTIIYGGTRSSGNVTGVNVNANAASTVTLSGTDIETCFHGVAVHSGRVTIAAGCYFERSIVQIYVNLPTALGEHFLNIKDTYVSVGSSSETGILLNRGSNIRVEDVNFAIAGTAASQNAISVTHNVNNCLWQNTAFRGIHPKYISGAGATLVITDRPGLEAGLVNVIKLYNSKTLNDSVAVALFSIVDCSEMVACKLRVWANKSGYGRAFREFAFTVTRNTALTQSPVVAIFDATDNTPSANWTVELTATLSGGAGSPVLVQVSADSGGALGNGTTTKVLAELEIMSDDAYPYVTVA